MSQKMQNKESCQISQDGEEEQARTLLELVTEVYDALEKERRLLARGHQRATGPLGLPPSRRAGAP